MYYKDNTEYNYCLPVGYSLSGVRNIGWLDKDVSFCKGISDTLFVDKLAEIILFKENVRCYVVNAIRGYYRCNLCNKDMVTFIKNDEKIYLGMSEILIPSVKNKEYFIFPSLILHYIVAHNYKPPGNFLISVTSLDLSHKFNAQDVYNEKIRELKLNFWS